MNSNIILPGILTPEIIASIDHKDVYKLCWNEYRIEWIEYAKIYKDTHRELYRYSTWQGFKEPFQVIIEPLLIGKGYYREYEEGLNKKFKYRNDFIENKGFMFCLSKMISGEVLMCREHVRDSKHIDDFIDMLRAWGCSPQLMVKHLKHFGETLKPKKEPEKRLLGKIEKMIGY